jgi:16S rRNA U516 pseudouridylate synthase RsuA-like enzyme
MDATTTTIGDMLRLIAAKSPATSGQATRALRMVGQPESRPIQYAIELALRDPAASFTEEERTAITSHIAPARADVQTLDIRLRVNPGDKQQIQAMADAADMTVSNFIRQKIGLPVL